MQSKEVVQMVFEAGESLLPLLDDMKDAPLTFPTPKGGNHPLWVIGHLTYVEGWIFWEVMRGEPNPVDAWKEPFLWGTDPSDDASKYPPYEEVLAKFREQRTELSILLASLSEADLDKESTNCTEKRKPKFGTWGRCFLRAGLHCLSHKGQLADARRALGRGPLVL